MESVDMTIDEALANADDWMEGQTFSPGSIGWRVTCAVLAEEVRRLRAEKWIDVKDDLPANGEDVLCLLEATDNTTKRCQAKTEVYSRVVGFYRPVQQWNQGKKEEFRERKAFKIAEGGLTNVEN